MAAEETKVDLDIAALTEGLLKCLVDKELAFSDDPLEVALAIAQGLRVAQLLALNPLLDAIDEFPATIQALLVLPEPALNPSQDIKVEEQDVLRFIDILDLLSDEREECIAPWLHRGWQDKSQSCRDARRLARAQVGVSLDAPFRKLLLKAKAICNRVFMVPPPVRIDLVQARSALAGLLRLIEMLLPEQGGERLAALIGKQQARLKAKNNS